MKNKRFFPLVLSNKLAKLDKTVKGSRSKNYSAMLSKGSKWNSSSGTNVFISSVVWISSVGYTPLGTTSRRQWKHFIKFFLNLSVVNALIVEKIAGKKKQQLDMVTKTWHTLQDSTFAWQGLDRSWQLPYQITVNSTDSQTFGDVSGLRQCTFMLQCFKLRGRWFPWLNKIRVSTTLLVSAASSNQGSYWL